MARLNQYVAGRLQGDLMRDFGLSRNRAAGITGQLAQESGGFNQLQEINPLRGRGGWGYAQWTGPRRREFEAFADGQGFARDSYEANYGFLSQELTGSERRGLNAVLNAPDNPYSSGRAFTDSFLRPGIPHYGSREVWTSRVMEVEPSGSTSNIPYTNWSGNDFGGYDVNAGTENGNWNFSNVETSMPSTYRMGYTEPGTNYGQWGSDSTFDDRYNFSSMSPRLPNDLATKAPDAPQFNAEQEYSRESTQLDPQRSQRGQRPSRRVEEAIDQQTRVMSATEAQNTQAVTQTASGISSGWLSNLTEFVQRGLWVLVGIVFLMIALTLFGRGPQIVRQLAPIRVAKRVLK